MTPVICMLLCMLLLIIYKYCIFVNTGYNCVSLSYTAYLAKKASTLIRVLSSCGLLLRRISYNSQGCRIILANNIFYYQTVYQCKNKIFFRILWFQTERLEKIFIKFTWEKMTVILYLGGYRLYLRLSEYVKSLRVVFSLH